MKKPKPTPQQALELYTKGKSLTEIGAILGCHQTTAGNLIIKAGGVLKTRSEAMRSRQRENPLKQPNRTNTMTPERAKELLPIIQAFAEGKDIEWMSREIGQGWTEAKSPEFRYNLEYRIKPQPKTRPWSKPEDVPGSVCWLRRKDRKSSQWLIHTISDNGVNVFNSITADLSWRWIEDVGCEHSTDRIHWKPCTITEE